MILERGTFVNDGDKDLLVCSIATEDGLTYALLLDLETDELGIYNISVEADVYSFNLVKDEKLQEKLLLNFSKYFVNDNHSNEE